MTKKPSFSHENTASQSIGITAAQIPVFGIDLNTGIPVLGIGIAIPSTYGNGTQRGEIWKLVMVTLELRSYVNSIASANLKIVLHVAQCSKIISKIL